MSCQWQAFTHWTGNGAFLNFTDASPAHRTTRFDTLRLP